MDIKDKLAVARASNAAYEEEIDGLHEYIKRLRTEYNDYKNKIEGKQYAIV